MRATFDTEKRPKPRSPSAHDSSAARPADAGKSLGAKSGLPFFLRECSGGCASTAPPPLQAKLVVGESGDEFEREADRAAQLATSATTLPEPTRRASAADELFVQPKPQASVRAPSKALDTVVGATGSGSALPTAVRHRVEPLLGVDLGDVRVHTDAAAHASARRLEAKAFTHQNHIWLGPQQSADDVELMAHELTHVVQQTGSEAPPESLQRQAEEEADGDAVQQRLQQRIDEALGERSPSGRESAAAAPAASATRAAEPATPAPATEDPEARQAARDVDRAAVRERAHELRDEAQPNVDRAAEQQPQIEESARATVQNLESPTGGQGEGAAARQGAGAAAPAGAAAAAQQQQAPGAGGGAAGAAGAGQKAAAALQQAAGAADEAFSAADSAPTPDTPEIIVPPPEISPADAGGQPLAGDPEADARAIELANDAQQLREQGQSLREQATEGEANAQILRGNVGLVGEGVAGAEGGVQTAETHLTFRRGLVEQARLALGVSERKASDVAAGAPRGVEQTNENKARSGPMASEARDLTARNNENTPDDPEDAADTREQGENFNRVGSDAATIDDTLTQVQGAANTLVQDSARATQLNSQVSAGAAAVEATLGRTEARIGQMQGQNAEARSQLEAVREQPAEFSARAGEVGAEGQDIVQSSRDIEARLHAAQQNYAARMATVPAPSRPTESEAAAPAEAPPAAVEASAPEAEPPAAVPEVMPMEESALVETGAPGGAGADAGEPPPPSESEPDASEDALVQRQPEDGAAAQPSNINIASGLPSWLTGVPEQNAAERDRQQREHAAARQADLDMIEAELHGRRFEQLSANERRMLALRVSTRNLFSGLGAISWPTPGGIARGAAHLAVGLIDPRGPMMGVVSGFNMIINSSVNFARQPSWSGGLRLAANVATGLAIILGSITALAGVIAAAMTALTIITLGIAAPFAGPIIAFCATVMTVVGGWTFWVGLIAAGLQALTFLVDLYMAGTAQTAEQLQQQSERMREDAGNAGNALLQAGMGRLAQVGGRAMRSDIALRGGGVRFAARMGARTRAAPGRALDAARSAGARAWAGGGRALAGARALGGRAVSGARALPGRVVAGARALPGQVAGGARAFVGGVRSLASRAASGAPGLPGRVLAGARTLGGRALTGARDLGGRALRGAAELPGRAWRGLGDLATGAVGLPGRAWQGLRNMPGRAWERIRREFTRDFRIGEGQPGQLMSPETSAFGRDFLLGEGITPGSGFRGLRNAASDARDLARQELAAEAGAVRGAAGATQAEAAAAESRPVRVDDAPPQSPAAREASARESARRESNELSNQQLRNELEHGLENRGLAEGTPPNRRMRMGDHEWRERPGNRWCRHSGAEICVETPHEIGVQLAETEARVQAARDRVNQARARVDAERQRLTGPDSDVQRFDAEMRAAREEAAGWQEIAESEARAGNASAAEAARAEVASAESRAQQALANKTQAEQQATQGIQAAEAQARVPQVESAALRAEQQLARQRQMAQEIDDLERQLQNELQTVHRGVRPPSSSDWARRKGALDMKRRELAEEMYRARGVTPQVKEQLRAQTPPKGATARQEVIDNMDDAFKTPGGDPLDIATGQRIKGSVGIDHLVPFEDIVQMDGFNQLTYQQQLRVLNHQPNLIPLSGGLNSSKLNRSLADWFRTPLGSRVPPAWRADLVTRQASARQSLRELIDHFLGGGT